MEQNNKYEQMINYLLGVMGELGRRILHVDAQSAQRYALTIERLSNAIARLALYQEFLPQITTDDADEQPQPEPGQEPAEQAGE